ncbi:MAG: 3-oxoacyl-ACP synthase [Bacteroidia bacterium]|nr:3-oxoacyl-ACP synthase [Bacteroidia bacterium]
MITIELKAALLALCGDKLREKEASILEAMRQAREALGSETKSTAGDKHETGRAMIQLEQEQLSQQLAVATESIRQLQRIRVDESSQRAGPGALIETSTGTYLVATGLGRLDYEGGVYFAVAPHAPIALAFAGRWPGDTIVFNNRSITITALV